MDGGGDESEGGEREGDEGMKKDKKGGKWRTVRVLDQRHGGKSFLTS